MAKSAAYRSQSANPHFSNHRTDQAPVEGTIPRGTTPFHYTSSVRDFVRAGEELKSPFNEERRASITRGETIFKTFCEPCHGSKGQGNGLVVQHGFPAPPSLLFGKALNMKDGHIFYIISVGFRKMPSYAAQIGYEDRWQVIAYVRKLQGQQQIP
jgi:mono/diheme cytochrome c family protein